jgi:hypothetical protein
MAGKRKRKGVESEESENEEKSEQEVNDVENEDTESGAGESDTHSEIGNLPTIRFINFKDFTGLGMFPRYPEN